MKDVRSVFLYDLIYKRGCISDQTNVLNVFFLIDFVIQLYLVEELASFVEYTVNWISRSLQSVLESVCLILILIFKIMLGRIPKHI